MLGWGKKRERILNFETSLSDLVFPNFQQEKRDTWLLICMSYLLMQFPCSLLFDSKLPVYTR